MATPLTITCPACNARLKLKDRATLGKKIACPKCKKPFIAKLLDEPDDEFDLGDETAEDDEFAAPVLPRRAAAPGKKSASAKKSKPVSSRGKLPLLIGGGAAVLLVGIVVTLWLLGVFSRGNRPAEVAAGPANPALPAVAANRLSIDYLPPASELFVVVRMADLWNAPLVKSLADDPQVQGMLQQLQQETGLTPADIESLTVGVAGLSERAADNPRAVAPLQLLSEISSLDALAVARLKKAVDAASLKLGGSGSVQKQYQGKSYFCGPVAPGEEHPIAVYLASPTLAVVGPEPSLKRSIERGDKTPERPELAFVDASHHILIAGVPADRKSFGGLPPMGATPESRLDGLIRDKVRGFSFGLKVSGGAAVEMALECADSDAAGQVRQEFDSSIAEARKSFAAAQGQLPPAIGQLGDLFLKSLTAAAQSTTVRVAGSVPDSAQQQLAQLPGQMMGLFLAGLKAPNGPPAMPPTLAADFTPAIEDSDGSDEEPLPQESLITEGVPPDVHVEGQAGWSRDPILDAANKPLPPRLELSVLITGGAAAETALYGMYKIDKISAAGGQALTYHELPFGKDPTKQMERRVVNDYFGRHPEDGVRATFVFEHPAQPVRNIAEFSGSVVLRIPKKSTTVTIKNVPGRVGKTIDHADLKKAGIQLKLVKEDFFMALKVMKGDVNLIGEVLPVDKDGAPIPGYRFIPSTSIKDDRQQFQWTEQDEFTKDMGLRITLFSDLSDVTVPFQFANLVVPPPPKPGDSVAGAPSSPPPSPPPKGPREVVKVTVAELCGDYGANASAAFKKYLNKSVEVTGKVQNVKRDDDGAVTIVLTDDGGQKLVVADGFTKNQDIERKVKEGQTITIRAPTGVLSGSISFVALTNCELVEGN